MGKTPDQHGRVLLQQNRVPEALAELRRATHLAPRSAEPHRLLGEAALRRGDYGTAQSQLLTATELNPRDADAWSTLGLLDLGDRGTVGD